MVSDIMSLSSCSTTPGTAETDACLRPDSRAVEPEVSILPAAHAILRLSIKKEESGLRDSYRRAGEQRLCCPIAGVHELISAD
jgi:hypothetical protein